MLSNSTRRAVWFSVFGAAYADFKKANESYPAEAAVLRATRAVALLEKEIGDRPESRFIPEYVDDVDLVVRLIEGDPHQFSKRPCATCKVITGILGRPFGCASK